MLKNLRENTVTPKKTSLSAGEIVRAVLLNSPDIAEHVTKIFPVVSDTAELPYIVYRRIGLMSSSVKSGAAADTATVSVICYTEHYTEGVKLAEAVRAALDGVQACTDDGMRMRSCYLFNSFEGWEGGAYLQHMTFNIKI